MRKKIARMAAGTLCLALTVGAAGCGSTTGDMATTKATDAVQGTTDQEVAAAVDSTNGSSSDADTSSAKITDNGKSIADFEQFVNGDWKTEQEKKNIGSVYIHDEEGKLVYDRTLEILNNTDSDSLSADNGLYKVVSIYKRMLDTSDIEKRYETAKRHLEPIEKVSSLDDLYELYGNEKYSVYNTVLAFNVESDFCGYNTYTFAPVSYTGSLEYHYNLMTGEPTDSLQEARNEFLSFMNGFGYDKDRTIEILENALKISKLIDEYYSESGTEITYYEKKGLDECGVTVPVIDIYARLNSVWKKRDFLAGSAFTTFLKDVYKEENVAALRDYHIFSLVSNFVYLTGEKMLMAEDGIEYPTYVAEKFLRDATDVLCLEYQNRFFEENRIENAKSMAEEVKDAMREIISETTWLTPHGQELAKHKLMTMHENYGTNGIYNDFEDLVITEDVAEDFISFLASNKRFNRSQVNFEDEKREIMNAILFEVNGRFIPDNNGFYITNALLGGRKFEENEAYEEKLAFFGEAIAHEIAHSFDPNGIDYNWKGYFEPWLDEDERAAYQEIIGKIETFYDGMETEYGYKIDGKTVTAESFADILAMECCLRILEKRENPDYDLFFKTYAREHAHYYDEQGAENAAKNEHLPAKQRINYTLGQFDKFYEVYDMDEASPYYVPEEKRISVY